MPLLRLLVRPWVAVAVFSAVTVATHLPAFVTAAVRSGPAHLGQHLALVPVSVAVRDELRPESAHHMVFVFFQSLVPSVAGASLIWADAPPYRVYEESPPLWGVGALDDQQRAGTIMEVSEGSRLLGVQPAAVHS